MEGVTRIRCMVHKDSACYIRTCDLIGGACYSAMALWWYELPTLVVNTPDSLIPGVSQVQIS